MTGPPHPTNHGGLRQHQSCVSLVDPSPSLPPAYSLAFSQAKRVTNTLVGLLSDESALGKFARDNVNTEIIFAAPPTEAYTTAGAMRGLNGSNGKELLACVELLEHLPQVKLMVINTDKAVETHFPQTLDLLTSKAEQLHFSFKTIAK